MVLSTQGINTLTSLNLASFWLVYVGGIIWGFSGLCAFVATAQLGMARAFGIWAPLNIVVIMLWGALLFGEFPNTDTLSLLVLGSALFIVIGGVILIISAKPSDQASKERPWLGYAGAVSAGVLWGSHFIPIQYAGVSMWVGAFPLALGMFSMSVMLVLMSGQFPRLHSPWDTIRTLLTGLIWGVGNYGMLLLVDKLGAGRGFTIAQLSIVVNAIMGILWLKDPDLVRERPG